MSQENQKVDALLHESDGLKKHLFSLWNKENDQYGSTTLFVHNCPDSVLDAHIRTHLCVLRSEDELKEDVTDELVGQIRHITRLYDNYIRRCCGGEKSHLPTEKIVKSYLQKTLPNRDQFFYILDDMFELSKKYGLEMAEMEFFHAIRHSSIVINYNDMCNWVQDWKIGKSEEFSDALQTWVDLVPKKMAQSFRPFFDFI